MSKVISLIILALFLTASSAQAAIPISSEPAKTELRLITATSTKTVLPQSEPSIVEDGDPDRPIVTGSVANPDPDETEQNNQTDFEFLRVRAEPSEVGGDSEDTGVPAPDTSPRAGFLKLGDIKGESSDSGSSSGNVEVTWKIEEGESAAKKPKEIVVVGSKTTDKSSPKLLLATCSGSNFVCEPSDVEDEDDLQEFVERHINENDSVNEVRMDDSNITIEHTADAKLFGFIRVNMNLSSTVSLDTDEIGRVKVKFPWWSVFAKKDIGQGTLESELQKAVNESELSASEVARSIVTDSGESNDRPTETITLNFEKVRAKLFDTAMAIIRKME